LASDLPDQVHDQSHGCGNDRCERGCHDERNGKLDEVAAHDEVFETLEHLVSSEKAPWLEAFA
jgi:hypothetical protein